MIREKKAKAWAFTIMMLAAAVMLLMPFAAMAGDLEPSAPPDTVTGVGTMHSLEDIY